MIGNAGQISLISFILSLTVSSANNTAFISAVGWLDRNSSTSGSVLTIERTESQQQSDQKKITEHHQTKGKTSTSFAKVTISVVYFSLSAGSPNI